MRKMSARHVALVLRVKISTNDVRALLLATFWSCVIVVVQKAVQQHRCGIDLLSKRTLLLI